MKLDRRAWEGFLVVNYTPFSWEVNCQDLSCIFSSPLVSTVLCNSWVFLHAPPLEDTCYGAEMRAKGGPSGWAHGTTESYKWRLRGSPRGCSGKEPACQRRRTWVWFLSWEDPLEEEMATHSSILAWRIPWTEEPGGLQSTGSQRVGHDWAAKHTTLGDSHCCERPAGRLCTGPGLRWTIVSCPPKKETVLLSKDASWQWTRVSFIIV